LAILKDTKKNTLYVKNEMNEIIGKLGYDDIALMYSELPTGIMYTIKNSSSFAKIVTALERMPELVLEFTRQGASSEVIRETIAKVYETAVNKIINISLEEMDLPNIEYSFLSLGSTSRHEMTLFSDQDNAIIFEDVDDKDLQKVRIQFLNLAEKVCNKMQKSGYPYCPGGVMAVNPKWCLSLKEWKIQFQKWISNPQPESILNIHVFFDRNPVNGSNKLTEELNIYIQQLLKEHTDFFIHYARNCLSYREPISYFGTIKAETKEGVKSINLKECIMPIVNFARIYSLKYDITESGTKDRLKKLFNLGIIQESAYLELIYLFNHLWNLRFFNQMLAHEGLRSVNDELRMEHLTDVEKSNLKNILSEIRKYQAKINYDFLGGTA
jgi:CBS domain-containing protein